MQSLITLLEEETLLLQSLVDAAMRQQQALIRLRAPELEAVTAEQEKLLGQMRQMERRRLQTMGEELGVASREAAALPLTEVLAKTEGRERDALAHLQTELRKLTGQLQEINSINRVLTHRARTGVREVMSFIEDNDVRVCNVTV